jgi:nitrilase
MRVAAIQMNSGADVDKNLQTADHLFAQAAEDGCQLVVLPENFALMPRNARDKIAHWIVGGSMPMVSPEAERVFGACPVYDAQGIEQACYRKIHLFDVKLPDSDEAYQESWSMFPGDHPQTVGTPIGKIGLTICYDLRFPELFRHLVDDGATVFTVPAAFTRVTGEAHWHTLLRARAIENLAYVIAPGQYGEHPDKRQTYGHSLIVDPWGKVLAEQAEGDCIVAADIDPDLPAKLRNDFPALANRRL